MDEIFTLDDKNKLFDCSKPMHDERMTSIRYEDSCIVIQYDELEDVEYYNNFSHATVKYVLDNDDTNFSLSITNALKRGKIADFSISETEKIDALNKYKLRMYKYSIDMWGEMTLHFNIEDMKKYTNVELSFTPIEIRYHWE